jgi:hypothetical protein
LEKGENRSIPAGGFKGLKIKKCKEKKGKSFKGLRSPGREKNPEAVAADPVVPPIPVSRASEPSSAVPRTTPQTVVA